MVWIVKRLPGQSSGTTNPTVLSVSQMCSVLVGEIWSEDKFRAAQMDDTLLGEVHGLLRDNPISALTISSDMKRLLDENLYISLNGILCRTSLEGRSQIVVPSVLIPEVLRLSHDEHLSGHKGSKKTLFRILCRFWWPTIQKDVVNYTQSCTICAQRMPVNKRARAPFLGRPKAAKPFEMIECPETIVKDLGCAFSSLDLLALFHLLEKSIGCPFHHPSSHLHCIH